MEWMSIIIHVGGCVGEKSTRFGREMGEREMIECMMKIAIFSILSSNLTYYMQVKSSGNLTTYNAHSFQTGLIN
jgi:hypothetical protein